jgi:dolichol-phosphate mannosyltransferase
VNNSETNSSTLRLSDISLGIVCPMANERATAVEFVKSVLEQCEGFGRVTFFAIMDNACKDGTTELLKKLQKEQPQLNVIWAPEDKCVVDAYIRGYREAVTSHRTWLSFSIKC